MCDVITREEWMRFVSPDCPPQLQARIFLHAASCPECKAFMEKQRALRHAVAMAAQGAFAQGTNTSGFQAVASAEGPSSQTGKGFLSVDFGLIRGALRFAPDTLQDEGYGQKYALNPAEDDTVLEDDLGALTLRLEGRELVLTMDEKEPKAEVRLLTDEEEPICFALSGTCRQELPDGVLYTLEIIF